MKDNISLLKFLVCTTLCTVNLIRLSLSSEVFVPSSKGNITRVKLFHHHHHYVHNNPGSKNVSVSPDKKGDSNMNLFGSVAKISRVVPFNKLAKVKYDFRNNSSKSEVKDVLASTQIIKVKPGKKGSSRFPPRNHNHTHRSRVRIRPDGLKQARTLTSPDPPSEPEIITAAAAVTPPPSSEIIAVLQSSYNVKEPMVYSSENYGNLDQHGNIFLNNNAIDQEEEEQQLSGEKQPRMLELSGNNNNNRTLLNPGVRFSARMKPVLNVTPLMEQAGGGIRRGPGVIIIKINNTDQRNVSGHISNVMPPSHMDMATQFATHKLEEITSKASLTKMRKFPPLRVPSSTTPSLMEVLSVPDSENKMDYSSTTTFSPPDPANLIEGFVPAYPPQLTDISYSSNENAIEGSSQEVPIPMTTTRKARGPSEEQQYQLPSITSTSTIEPEVEKGYQTILESTTEGPKVVWYNHQQTPEDTFFPNSDPYLVPPDELPIDSISEMKPVKDELIINDSASKNMGPYSTLYNNNNFGGGGGASSYESSKSSVGGDALASSSKYGNARGIKSHIRLQPAATIIDHQGIRELYEDDFRKNGGSSAKRFRQYIPRNHQHNNNNKERGQYDGFLPSYYAEDSKDREIVPPRHQNNKPYVQDDAPSYPVAFNEYQDHHYHDSYPPKDEISPNNGYQGGGREPSGDDYYKEELGANRPPYRGNDQPSSDIDYRRPASPPQLDFEKGKEGSPGGGGGGGAVGYGHGPVAYNNPGGGYQGGFGGGGYQGGYQGGYHKGFFAQAKDYFKNSDFSTAEKWFDVSIGVFAFLAFGAYIIMLLYQVFTISSGTTIGQAFGKSFRGAGELFDMFMAKSPLGQQYMDELEWIVKMAMANVKRSWVTNSLAEIVDPKKNVKGEAEEAK